MLDLLINNKQFVKHKTAVDKARAICILFCLLCVNNLNAQTQKASIVFTAKLNEITTKSTGGYAELASLLAQERKKNIPTFFIFGGASLFPSILSSFDNGSHIIDLLNSLEPDVMSASNGDFSFSEDELSLRSYEAAFPIVISNIEDISTKQNLDGLLNSVLIQQGSYKFGFISLIDEIVIEKFNLTRIKIKNQNQAIATEVKKLREQGAELIIMNYRGSTLNVIKHLQSGSVDLVLRKNTHINLSTDTNFQKHPRQIMLTEADQAAVIELNWQQNKPKSLTVELQKHSLSTFPAHPIMHKQMDIYRNKIASLLNEKIGITTTDIDTSRISLRTKENAFANLIADLIKEHSNADIALINGGMIRGESFHYKNNKLSRGDIIKTLPYRESVSLLEVSGSDLLSALENGFSQIDSMAGRFPQVSGMKIVYDSKAKIGQRIISVAINNKPLEVLKHYKLATPSFIANGGDGYTVFKDNNHLVYNQQMSKLISDILISELRLSNVISPVIEDRVIDVNKTSKEL
ncbi:MAG: 5'-nucleotidase C-terminal domain-containing protein [Psychromonas sp.]